MDYPVDNAFLLRHAVAACCRYRLLLLIFSLAGCLLSGFAVWGVVPAEYQIRGIFLLNGQGNSRELEATGENLMTFFRNELKTTAASSNIAPLNVDCMMDSQSVAGSVAIHWSIDCTDYNFERAFSEKLPEFIQDFQKNAPRCQLAFSVDDNPFANRDFKRSLLWSVAGCGGGLLIGFIFGCGIVFILVGNDHSISDICAFSKNNSLPIAGVLPEIEVRGASGSVDPGQDEHFIQAVNSLLLNVQFCKHASDRAFIVMVSALERGNGSTVIATQLAAALNKANYRVLLLNKENCNMDVSPQLARKMETLLAEYTTGYDFIIIDAPDIQRNSVPLIVSKLVDMVLLVCDCRKCPGYPLQVVLWRLKRAQVNAVWCVVNHFPLSTHRKDYELYQLSYRGNFKTP